MLYEKARKMFLTGLGFAAITKEKAEVMVKDLVKEGELSKEEGRELLETWTAKIEQEKEEVRGRVQREVNRMIDNAGLVSKEEYRALEARVAALEEKLNSEQG